MSRPDRDPTTGRQQTAAPAKVCATCRHWHEPYPGLVHLHRYLRDGWRLCARAQGFGDGPTSARAFAADGSAFLATAPTFGCVQHQLADEAPVRA